MAEKFLDELLRTIKQKPDTKNRTHSAIVSKVDDEGTVWVYIAGSDIETPTASATAEVKSGDAVNVEWRNNRLFIAGNYSNPSAGVVRVNSVENAARVANNLASQANESASVAKDAADRAVQDAGRAHIAADEAKESAISANNSANNALTQLGIVEDVSGTLRWISEHGTFELTEDTTVQEGAVYFIYEGGDYVPIASPDPTANPSEEGWYILDVTQSTSDYIMSHLAVTSAGLWVLPVNGLAGHPLVDSEGNQLVDSDSNPIIDFSSDPQCANGYKVLLSGTGMTVFNGEGESVAFYGEYAQVGKSSGAHSVIDENGQRFYAVDGSTLLANIGYGEGAAQSGTDVTPYYTFGRRRSGTTVGNYSVSEGSNTEASGYAAHAEGCQTTANETYSHAEGYMTTASGNISHGEGDHTVAYGTAAHAEGSFTTAYSGGTHAEGYGTYAKSPYCHAEGYNTVASGEASHTGGKHTVSTRDCQTVIGQYNKATRTGSGASNDPYVYTNATNAPFVIGNGHGDDTASRSDAFFVDWDGMTSAGGYGSLDGSYLEICVGDITTRAKEIDTSLTSSSTEEAWLTAVIKAICEDYPLREYCNFKGNVRPNSARFFNLQIYDTSNKSGGLPQYSFGWCCGYGNGFRLFGTASYGFTSRAL